MEYQTCEVTGRGEGQDWATNRRKPIASLAVNSLDYYNIIACLTETKALHYIPRSYKHAMATNPERWMVPMKVKMETLKGKHMWDLVKPPPKVNVIDLMWIYDIKWDREGYRIKDKARLVGKGYTQQLGFDYNKTWDAVI